MSGNAFIGQRQQYLDKGRVQGQTIKLNQSLLLKEKIIERKS